MTSERFCPDGHPMIRRPKGNGWRCRECDRRAAAERRAKIAAGLVVPEIRPPYNPEEFPCGHPRTADNSTCNGRQCRACRSIYDRDRHAAKRADEGKEVQVFDPDWFPCGHPRTPSNLTSHNCCRVCGIDRAMKYSQGKVRSSSQSTRDGQRLLKKCEREERADPETMEYVRIIRNDPCSYCGKDGGTRDHIIPMTAGGPNHWENYTGACTGCNAGKSDKSMLIYLLDRMDLATARRQRRTA